MRQAARLELPGIPEQRPRRAERGVIARLDPQPVEPRHAERARQFLARELGIELVAFALGPGGAGGREHTPGGKDDLGRFVAGQRRRQLLGRGRFEQQLTGREVERREPSGCAPGIHGDEEVVAAALEPVVRQHCARRDGLHHFAPHEPLREPGVFDLLADGDPMSQGDQPPQILGRGLDRNAGEGHVDGAAVVARRERETQLPRSEPGVIIEHLVEVSHSEEQDRVGIPRLDVAILLHQRRVGLEPRHHGCSTTNGWPPSRVLSRRCAWTASSRVA